MIIDEVPVHLTKKPPQNLVELCQEYKTSTWYTKLKPVTQKDYERFILALLGSPYGLKPLDFITPRIADVIYNRIKEENGKHQAAVFVSVWRRIFEFAEKYDYITRNPWRRVQVETPPSRQVAWSENEVFQVIEHAIKVGNKPLAVAICLLYDTGQRPSDIMYLTYGNIKKDELGYYLDITQSKRNAHVKPALSKYTVGLLGGPEAIDARHPEDLVVEVYKNLKGLQYDFAKVRKELGLKSIQMRDLRRTALTEMGEASDDCMVSVSGHRDRNMLNIYSIRTRHKALEAQRIRHATRNSRLNQDFTSPAGTEEKV